MAISFKPCAWMACIVAVSPLAADAQPQPGQAPPQAAFQKPQVVATVNGDPITQREVDITVQRHLQQQQTQRPEQMSPEAVRQIKPQAIKGLIESRLVEQYAIKEGPAVNEKEVKASVDHLKSQLTEQGSTFQQFLASQGHTAESFRTRIKGSIAWHKFQQEQMTDKKLQQFFEQNQTRFNAENMDQVRGEVTESYLNEVWKQIVAQMRPDAEIRMADQKAAPRPR